MVVRDIKSFVVCSSKQSIRPGKDQELTVAQDATADGGSFNTKDREEGIDNSGPQI